MILLLASSGISLVLAILATVSLLRLHSRRILFRGFRLWRPLPEPTGVPQALLPAPQPLSTALSPASLNIAYPDNSLAPNPSRRTRSHAIARLDRGYFREDSGNLEDPAPPRRIQPDPVSLPPHETRLPRKSA